MDAQEFAQLVSELPDEVIMPFLQRLEPQLFADMRGMDLADAKNYVTVRVLQAGTAVSTLTTAGTSADLLGHSVGDTLNFLSPATVTINDSNRRQFDIKAGGGGADCMFDFLVSSCFSSLSGFVEGTTYTALSGCTFKGYSTVQGVMTYLDANSASGSTWTIYLCGFTNETVTLTYPNNGWGNLYFYGNGAQHSGFTTLSLNGPESTTNDVNFYDMRFTTVSADSGSHATRFYRCTITTVTTGSTLADLTSAVWDHCQVGNFTTIANPLNRWDSIAIRDCVITGSIDLSGAGTHQADITGNVFTAQTGAIKLKYPDGCRILHNHFRSNTLTSTVPQIVISGFDPVLAMNISNNTFNAPNAVTVPSCVINITNTDYTDVAIVGNNFGYSGSATSGSPFLLTASNAKVCATVVGNNFGARNNVPTYIETDGGVSIEGVFIHSAFGLNTPDNFALTLLTGSSDNVYLGTGTVTGTGATNIYALSSSPYVTIGNDSNLSAERALTAGNGVGFTDGGANSTVTLNLANLTGNWTQAGVFDISTAGNLTVLKHLAVGAGSAISANSVLSVVETETDPAAAQNATSGTFAYTLTAGNANAMTGMNYSLTSSGAFTLSGIMAAFKANVSSAGSTITDARDFWALSSVATLGSVITNRYGLYVDNATGSGTVTNQYGIYIASMTKGGTLNYGIYQAGGQNFLGGEIISGPVTAPATPASGNLVTYNESGTQFLKTKDASGNVYNMTHDHVFAGVVDASTASTTVPFAVIGPMPHAGTITDVRALPAENKTGGATSGIFDVHQIAAASVNTDGQGTTIFTTQANRPTISNGNKLSTTTAPDVTSLAAGDYLALYTDQVGTNLTFVSISITVRYT